MNKISIIIPFYKGTMYINRLLSSINEAIVYAKSVVKDFDLEVIIVNDSPEIEIHITSELCFIPIILTNMNNVGIHQSRINGLVHSSGDSIIFIDQDDILAKPAILSYLNVESDVDVIVSNGLVEYDESKYVYIFNHERNGRLVEKNDTFFVWKNLIVSPGQCLIKKKSIPNEWISTPLDKNGVDDYYLWILMKLKNLTFKYIDSLNYIHKFTGINLSNNRNKMYESVDQLISYLSINNSLNQGKIMKIKRMIEYRKLYRTNFVLFILSSFFKPNLFIITLYYELFYTKKRVYNGDK